MKTCLTVSPSRAIPLFSLTNTLVLCLLLVSTLLYLSQPANAQVYRNWTGAASASWSNPNNWDPVGLPQNGESLWFEIGGNTSMINDIPNLIINSLGFVERDWVLSGNPLTIGGPGGGGIIVASTRTDDSSFTTINCALILNSNDSQLRCHAFDGSSGRLRINADINLNGFDLLLYASSKSIAGLADGTGHIEMNGSISGNGNVTAMASGYPDGTIEFLGTADNTFTGTLFIEPNVPASADGVFFNKQAGAVANYRIVMAEAAWVNWRNSNQVGDTATVVVKDGSRLNLNSYNETIGNLVLTNISADANPSLVDTGNGFGDVVGTLTVNDGIVSWVNNVSVLPIIKGVLNLPAGDHNFFVSGTSYAGLDMQAKITGAGGFTKYGNAALLLKGTNTFGGTVSAGGGIIDVYHPNGFGSPAGGVELIGGSVTLRNLTIASETLSARGLEFITAETAGSLLFSVGASAWTGPILLETNLVVSGGNMILSGPISGAGGLDFRTFGTAQLGGGSANTYNGKTLVRCPLLQLNKPLGVNAYAGPLEVGGGTGGPYEVEWLNSYLSPNTSLTLFADGVVNLNDQVDNFGPVIFNGGTVETATGFFIAENSITANPATTTAIMNGNLSLGITPFNIGVGNGGADPDLRINAVIYGANLSKYGPGTLTLAGANNHSGSTFAAEGILHADNSAAFGTLSGNTIVADGATIRLGGVDGMAEAIQLNGTGFQGTNGALQVAIGGTIYGQIFLSSPSTINCLGGLAINSIISGSGPLTKTGAGNLFLGGVSGGAGNNTYTGGTMISAGTLYLSKNPNVIAAPGNLVVGPATPSSPATARWYNTGTMTAGAVATVNANSLLDLNGYNQLLSQLNLNDGGDVQTGAGTMSFSASGSVNVGTLNPPPAGLQASSLISGRLAASANNYLLFNVGSYGLTPISPDPELIVTAQISGNLSSIAKNGSGTMRLSGNNTFAGSVAVLTEFNINHGRVIAASTTALGGADNWVYVSNGASLALVENITINNKPLYLNSTNPAALDNPGGNNVWNGPITLSRDSGIGVNLDWSLTTTGVIGGPGSLTKVGAGALWLAGAANNTHAGNTFVHEGWLGLAKSPFLQAVPANLIVGKPGGGTPASVLYVSPDQVWGDITVNNGGGLNLNDYNEYIGILTLNGGGDVFTGTGILNLSAVTVNPGGFADQSVISGRLGLFPGLIPFNIGSGSSGTGEADCLISAVIGQCSTGAGLLKNGAGRLRLTGNSTYTGETYIGEGTLQVDGVQPQSPVTLDHDTHLQGSGTVGDVLLNGGATTIAPGTSPGTLTCSNLIASGGNGTLQIELNGPTPGSTHDQINVRGTVDLLGLKLSASLGFNPAVGDQFIIINNDGSDAVTGTFTGLPQNKKLYVGSELFQISYTGGSGNDVVLTRLVTPPPPTLTIQRVSPASVRLLWPTNDPTFSLQSKANLNSTNWIAATPLPSVSSTNHVVTNVISGVEKYYRLVNP